MYRTRKSLWRDSCSNICSLEVNTWLIDGCNLTVGLIPAPGLFMAVLKKCFKFSVITEHINMIYTGTCENKLKLLCV